MAMSLLSVSAPGDEDAIQTTQNRVRLATAAFFGAHIVLGALLRALTGPIQTVLHVMQFGTWLGFGVVVVALVRMSRAMASDPALRAAVNDERQRDIGLRAYRAAFWATLAAAVVLTAAGNHLLVGAGMVAQSLMFVDLATVAGTRFVLERK
jgi:hypothetical protein